MSVRILILIGTGEGLQIADELTRLTKYEVYVFLDKRSRIKTNFNIVDEISSLKKKIFYLGFCGETELNLLLTRAIHSTNTQQKFV